MQLLVLTGKLREDEDFIERLRQEGAGICIKISEYGKKEGDPLLPDGRYDAVILYKWGLEPEILQKFGNLELPVFVAGYGYRENYYEEIMCLEAGIADYFGEDTPAPIVLLRIQRILDLLKRDTGSFHYYHDLIEKEDRMDYRWKGEYLGLTPTEYRLLHLLLTEGPGMVEKERLLALIWKKQDEKTENACEAMIRKLRGKLSETTVMIRNYYGKGYGIQFDDSTECKV